MKSENFPFIYDIWMYGLSLKLWGPKFQVRFGATLRLSLSYVFDHIHFFLYIINWLPQTQDCMFNTYSIYRKRYWKVALAGRGWGGGRYRVRSSWPRKLFSTDLQRQLSSNRGVKEKKIPRLFLLKIQPPSE